MHGKLRQAAVDDVLEYCRNSQHVLNKGRLLAPVLLGDAWGGEQDDYHLAAALQALIAEELARWRQKLGVKQRTPTDERKVDEIVRDDLATHHQKLVPLSLVWAYYIDHLTTAQLAQLNACSRRSIQLKIQEGRIEIARLIAQQELATVSSRQQRAQPQHDQDGQQPSQLPAPHADATSPTSPHIRTAPQPLQNRTHAHRQPDSTVSMRRLKRRRINQDISGDNVQAVIGPVSGPVNQHQTQHIHHYDSAGERKTVTTSDTSTFWACLLLLMVAGYWLIQSAPWLSVGTLLLICGWRAGRHGWHTLQEWSRETSLEEVSWRTCYTLAWLGALVWTAFMALRLQAIVATPKFSFEHLFLIFSFVGVSAYVFWLSTLDLLLWVHHAPTIGWPWHLLKRHAKWCWQQRWIMLGITWLALVVFSGSMLFFRFGGGEWAIVPN